jgi:hypothetical protein
MRPYYNAEVNIQVLQIAIIIAWNKPSNSNAFYSEINTNIVIFYCIQVQIFPNFPDRQIVLVMTHSSGQPLNSLQIR